MEAIQQYSGQPVEKTQTVGASGWSSQLTMTVRGGTKFFVKTSRRSAAEMFDGEALGLTAMYGALLLLLQNSRPRYGAPLWLLQSRISEAHSHESRMLLLCAAGPHTLRGVSPCPRATHAACRVSLVTHALVQLPSSGSPHASTQNHCSVTAATAQLAASQQ